MITYSNCPCCGSDQIRYELTAKDHTVSGQSFEIWECGNCSLRFTQYIPEENAIGSYYQSDSYISHTDTRQGLINRLYHIVRKKTLRDKKNTIERFTGLRGGSLLDIGAGTGAFLLTMKNAGWKHLGLEPDPETRKRALDANGILLQEPAKLPGLASNSQDAVTMWHVLEHVHELHSYITHIKRIMKPGAILFIAVPNYTSYDAGHYSASWAAYDVPRHLYHFSPAAIKSLLEKHALKLIAMRPMWFDSFYVSMLSEQYKNGHTGNIRAISIALMSNIKTLFNREKCSSILYIIQKDPE